MVFSAVLGGGTDRAWDALGNVLRPEVTLDKYIMYTMKDLSHDGRDNRIVLFFTLKVCILNCIFGLVGLPFYMKRTPTPWVLERFLFLAPYLKIAQPTGHRLNAGGDELNIWTTKSNLRLEYVLRRRCGICFL